MVCSRCAERMKAIRMLMEENEKLKKQLAEVELHQGRTLRLLEMQFAHTEHLLQTLRENQGQPEEIPERDRLYG